MQEKQIKRMIDRARKEAKARDDAPSEQYLCYRVFKAPTVGGLPAREEKGWGIYTTEQQGYIDAIERIPLYPEERTIVEPVEWWR